MIPVRFISRKRIDELLDGLRALHGRSVLALMGIAIGSSSITAMINVGHNATENALEVFKGMGTDIVIAHIPSAKKGEVAFRLSHDHETMRKQIPGLGFSATTASGYTNISYRGKTHTVSMVGASAELYETMGLQMQAGRFISEFDYKATFVVVGHDLAQSLGDDETALKVGEQIRLGHYYYTIIGIMKKGSDNQLTPFRTDNAFILPIESMRRLDGPQQVDTVIATTGTLQSTRDTAITVKNAIEQMLQGREVKVRFAEQMIEGMRKQTQTFNYLLIALGGISLIGAGVGVMNVMLMNVSERRREIGIRIALGARRTDIRILFLGEAMTLTSIGAVLGVVLGIGTAWLYATFTGWAFSLTISAVLLSSASTLLVGLFFGIYPAIAAARLQPVKALRDA